MSHHMQLLVNSTQVDKIGPVRALSSGQLLIAKDSPLLEPGSTALLSQKLFTKEEKMQKQSSEHDFSRSTA